MFSYSRLAGKSYMFSYSRLAGKSYMFSYSRLVQATPICLVTVG